MSNKELSGNNNESPSGSEWDILSSEIQDEIQEEAAEDAELANEQPQEEENTERDADYYRKHEEEIGNMIQDLIRLRGEDSVKQGDWDNDQKSHIDGNGMPTDYAHLVRYAKDNPDSLETLTKEYNDRLAQENRVWTAKDGAEASALNEAEESTGKYSDMSYDDYMRQFANPFEGDELAQEIAETNPPREGESGDEYEARIRRNAELFRAAEKSPRDATKESQEAYNKRIAAEVDAKLEHDAKIAAIRDRILNSPDLKTTTEVYDRYEDGDKKGQIILDEDGKAKRKVVERRVSLDPSRPLWGQLLDEKGRRWLKSELEKDDAFPRNEGESIQEWQNRVESELGLKIWKSTPEASTKAAKTGDNTAGDNPDSAATSPDGSPDDPNNSGKAKDGKRGDSPFPHSAAFANNPYAKWYKMSRDERQAAAEQGQAAAAQAAEGDQTPASTENKDSGSDSKERITVSAPGMGKIEIDMEAARKAAEADKKKPEDKDKAKKAERGEMSEKYNKVCDKLDAYYSAIWGLLSKMSRYDSLKNQLEETTGFFNRGKRKKIEAEIAKVEAEGEALKQKFPEVRSQLIETFNGTELSQSELNMLKRHDQTLFENCGRGGSGTVSIEQSLKSAKSQLEKWSKELAASKKRRDRFYIDMHTENVESAKRDVDFYEGVLRNRDRSKIGLAFDDLELGKEEVKSVEQLRDEYNQAVQEGQAFDKDAKEQAAKLPEDQRASFFESLKEKRNAIAAKIGEASRPLSLEAAARCVTEKLAQEWKEEVSKTTANENYFIYRNVTEILPGLVSGNIEAAKRVYEKAKLKNNEQGTKSMRAAIEEKLQKFFGASEEFLAQLRGEDGETKEEAA